MRICLIHFAIALAVISVTITPPAYARGPSCPADIAPLPDGDCVVNVSDLLLVIAEWGMAGSPADINGDGTVNVTDLLEVIAAWGPCSSPTNDECLGAPTLSFGESVSDHLRDATQDSAPSCTGDCDDFANPKHPCSESELPCTISATLGKWYKIVGDGTVLTASLCQNAFEFFWDAKLSVYTGPNCCNISCCVARNTDCCGFFSEEATWCSDAGQNYFILVHTDFVDPKNDGNFVLAVTSGQEPCAFPCGG